MAAVTSLATYAYIYAVKNALYVIKLVFYNVLIQFALGITVLK